MVQRRKQRLAAAVLTQHSDPLGQISNSAFEGDNRVARRKVIKNSRHCGDLFAHRCEVCVADALIGPLAPGSIQSTCSRANVFARQFGRRWGDLVGSRRAS